MNALLTGDTILMHREESLISRMRFIELGLPMGAVSIDDFNHNPDVAGRVKGVTSLLHGLGRRGGVTR